MSGSIVLGANGQDGSYLCEALAASGQRVLAIGRQADYAKPLPSGDFRYLQVDLTDHEALRAVLSTEHPDHIYHVAAVHGESGFSYESVVPELFAVSVLSVHVCLEYLREIDDGRLFYASSSKVFGDSPQQKITEKTAKRADCLYSTAKIAAGNLIECYRRNHGVGAIIAHLFNHESPRRQPAYFVPKVARALSNGLAGAGEPVVINSLEFFADFGSAREYMEMSVKAMELGLDGEYVVATGQTVWAAEAVESLFESHKLDYRKWLQAPVPGDKPGEIPFIVDIGKLTDALACTPELQFPQLVEEIADAIRRS
jgi:GDPmannose 4,6-dehydratase